MPGEKSMSRWLARAEQFLEQADKSAGQQIVKVKEKIEKVKERADDDLPRHFQN